MEKAPNQKKNKQKKKTIWQKVKSLRVTIKDISYAFSNTGGSSTSTSLGFYVFRNSLGT